MNRQGEPIQETGKLKNLQRSGIFLNFKDKSLSAKIGNFIESVLQSRLEALLVKTDISKPIFKSLKKKMRALEQNANLVKRYKKAEITPDATTK